MIVVGPRLIASTNRVACVCVYVCVCFVASSEQPPTRKLDVVVTARKLAVGVAGDAEDSPPRYQQQKKNKL